MKDSVGMVGRAVVGRKSGSSALSDRQPRKLENHRKLLAAARKLFIEKGSHQTTTHDIARLAGLVHGTFYSHFKDKTDCFIEFLYDVENELVQTMEWFAPPDDESPVVHIHSWLSSMFSYARAQPGALSALLLETVILSTTHERRVRTPPLGKRWIELADKWKETGLAAPDFDSRYFFALMKGAVRQGDAMLARNPEREEKITEEMTRFIVRSIKADRD